MWPSLALSTAVSCLLCAQIDPVAKESDQEATLARKITIDKELSGSLEKVLEALSDRFNVSFVIDPMAFESKGYKDVMKAEVKVPSRKDVELRRVLLDLLKPLQGTCRAGKGYIEILPALEKQSR
jgi:hypothetical protein